MADSSYEMVEVRFDVRDPDQTHVYVYIEAHGDSPFMVQGWHHKAYPASLSTSEIHQRLAMGKNDDSPVLWPRLAPQDVAHREAGQLAKAILTWDMGMDPTQPQWAYWESLRMLAESVVGERIDVVRPRPN
ncbi:hypothetical protein [Paraburkholderia youngii]|uniref:hypothetical protein n=1 Tax=Paraburkholderia youngii TaxID=2782701 RepID=UPI001590B072|nr:hypothetical protein [Paraburkholderia youngii]NUX58700.1 hypothetical protein [Paraburkholderia youngii]